MEDDNGAAPAEFSSSMKNKNKKPRTTTNEDELDDIDEWQKGDDDQDDDEEAEPSERELLEAKRRRRQRREGDGSGSGPAAADGDERTRIDDMTSLATEGIAIEPFNMDQERTDGSGYFEGDTYIFRSRDKEEEEPDAWLESLNDNDNGKDTDASSSGIDKPSGTDSRITAMVLGNQQTMKNKKKAATTTLVNMDDWSLETLYNTILPLLSDTESVTQGVRRYGLLLKRKQKPGKAKNGKPSAPIDQPDQDDSRHTELAKTCLDDLTGAANALLFKGDVDIYDSTRNDILKRLPQRPLVQEEHSEPVTKYPAAQWEYMGNQDGQVHGPYSTEQMLGWTQAGYFIGAQHVKIRTIRPGEPLSTEDDLLADLMDDDDDDGGDKKDEVSSSLIKGEWQSSNDVDFKEYL
jgi:CD2 antigen cytoplasmic tail-binding protein 2